MGDYILNVKPVKILSPEMEDMIRYLADECERLGLKFIMQNCSRCSMAGYSRRSAKSGCRNCLLLKRRGIN